jgi:Na+/melibiose symporter-like transporter
VESSTLFVAAIVMGVVCSIGCVVLAKSKNRNAVGFFLLGLFLGVVGFIAALLIPAKGTVPPARTASTHGPSG